MRGLLDDKWCVAILRITRFRPMPRACVHFGTTSVPCGDDRFGDVVSGTERRGFVSRNSWRLFCPPFVSDIPGRKIVLLSTTQGGSPVRNYARRDLCGGRSAMSVPTAILCWKKTHLARNGKHPLLRMIPDLRTRQPCDGHARTINVESQARTRECYARTC